ncbi:DoxX family protein [Acidisoma sp. C75]
MRALSLARALIAMLDRTPYAVVGLVARLALAKVFWSSAQTHLASWNTTLYLFANSYNVPLLPPSFAAYLAVTLEIVTPPLLLLGLGTRFTALALLGMTAVIEIFIYPQAWPTHIQWAAMQLILIAQGAGAWSADAFIARRIARA